jgi:sugar O-acyltransferase (sialic acid O-acetyltransferase NeuD family)
MINQEKKVLIFGTGGFGGEVLCCLIDKIAATELKIEEIACFMVSDEYYRDPTFMGIEIIPQSKFNPNLYDVVVAIGDPKLRRIAIESLPQATTYTTIIHPSAIISKWVEIGEGSIITAGTIITCNIKIGKHAHLNLNTTIGHDCQIGDFFTTAPSASISGKCSFGNCVYFGANSSVRERVSICNNVTIGMGGVVVKDIVEEGVYIGNPLKKLEKK